MALAVLPPAFLKMHPNQNLSLIQIRELRKIRRTRMAITQLPAKPDKRNLHIHTRAQHNIGM
jgi:hypothetical protein